jgi:uncharacterized metal-binding protein
MQTRVNRNVLPKVPKGAKIIIPNAEALTPEELKKAKHAEKMRRYMARKRGSEPTENYGKIELKKIGVNQMIELATDTRNLAVQTLNNKLVEVNSSPEKLEKVSLKELATVFGILFDKSRVMEGLATENIAIHAKIDVLR